LEDKNVSGKIQTKKIA